MMHDPIRHPDDERLSALAAGDGDVQDDRALRDHVDQCATCRPVVEELLAMRTALAQLPDVSPPRPLRLLPAVPKTPTSGGGWMRRLFAPALVAGLVLTVAGGVGTFVDQGIPALTSTDVSTELSGGAAQPAAASAGAGVTYDAMGRHPSAEPAVRELENTHPSSRRMPWLPVLGGGLALVVAALALRFVVQPRAG